MVYMPHWPQVLGKRPIDLGLERIQSLLKLIGSPEKKMPPIVHVAGTNGKGSTIAFLQAILKSAQYRVQVYTSPHLMAFNERIRLDDHLISDEELFEVCEICRLVCDTAGLHPTVFEGTTAAAFLAFSRHVADVCILETGLGGRLDATNIFPQPECTIITPISMDHMDYLGHSIEEIAFEKAGIIKPNVPCILGQQPKEVVEVIAARAQQLNAPLFIYGQHWLITSSADGMRYVEADYELVLPKLALEGLHQYQNAGAAIAASRRMIHYSISEENLLEGLQTAVWPGRLQPITQGTLIDHLPQGWELWLDGGHNPGGADVLAAWIVSNATKPTCLIVGLSKGKDSRGFFQPMLGKVAGMCGVCVKSEPTAQTADSVTEAALAVGLEAVSQDNLLDAISYFTQRVDEPARILICGSLFLIGDVLKENGRV